MRKSTTFLAAFLLAAPAFCQQTATGIVFNDLNGDGMRNDTEPGIVGVRVSNQREVTVTDRTGRYQLPVTDDTIIFVVKPRDWSTPVDKNMVPRYYYIHKPNGSPKQRHPGVSPTGPLPESIDFPLQARKEAGKFKALFFGDLQVRPRDIPLLAHQILAQIPPGEAVFAMTQGDNTSDNVSWSPQVAETMAALRIPVYYAMGNHDENYDPADDTHTTESFQSHFGPEYYSFDYGPVHFITLEDIKWGGKGYKAGLGEKQLAWLKNDLEKCPKKQLVVLSYHIPLLQLEDRNALFSLLEKRPNVLAVAGHTHWMSNHFIEKAGGFNRKEPLHELINATTCGSWWGGPRDDQGLPNSLMSDGAPNGYTLFTFDGSKYSAEYRVARRPADYQMAVFAPDTVQVIEVEGTEVFANVFAGSERSTVEMRIDDGEYVKMDKVQRPDPFLTSLKAAEPPELPENWKFRAPMPLCPHLWAGKLPSGLTVGAHVINVRTTDMYGQKYDARRVIVVR